MALKGDLRSIQLADVFQMLMLSQKTGTLEIYADGKRTSLYFNGRGVLLPYHPESFEEKVLRLLMRRGVVNEHNIESALMHKHLDESCARILVKMGIVSEADLDSAYCEQMEEEIYDLFFVQDASFEFREGQEPDVAGRQMDDSYLLSANSIIMEAARRVDEWEFIRRKVPSELCVFRSAISIEEVPPNEGELSSSEVIRLLDGQQTIRCIVERTGYPRYQVCKVLSFLAEERAIYEVDPEELCQIAEQQIHAGKHRSGINLLERAFEREADDPRAIELAAEAYEALGDVGQSCHFLRRLAEIREQEGEVGEALPMYVRVREKMPTDVTCRERLSELFLSHPEAFQGQDFSYDAVREACELAHIQKAIGHSEQAGQTLVRVHERFVGQFKVTSDLAQIAVEMAEARVAISMLLAAGEHFEARRNFSTALRLYRRVRSIDATHSGLEARLRSCQKAMENAAPRQGPMLRMLLVLLACGGLCAGGISYNFAAVDSLRGLRSEELALQGDFDRALAQLEDFQSSYPVTVAALVARKSYVDLQRRREDFKERTRLDQEEEAHEKVLLQKRAEWMYEEARKKIHEGDYPEALELLLKSSEVATDSVWKRTEAIESKAGEIRLYLENSEALYRSYVKAVQAAEYSKAHEAGVKLLRSFPLSPRVRGLFLPVLVETTPPGVQLVWSSKEGENKVEGEATTPALLQLPGESAATLSLQMKGFHPLEQRIHPATEPRVSLALERRPDAEGDLPARPLFPPLVVGKTVVAACQNGRVVEWNLATSKLGFSVTLPNLEEHATAPLVYQQSLIARGKQGHVYLLSLTDGSLLQTLSLAADPVGPMAVYRGVLVSLGRTSQGAVRMVAINLTDGEQRWSADLTGEVTAGPISVSGGFVVGFRDGRILYFDGRMGEQALAWNVAAPVESLGADEDHVFAASQSGIQCFPRRAGAAARWTQKLPSGQTARRLLLTATEVLVQTDARVHRFRLPEGQVIDSVPGSLLAFPDRNGRWSVARGDQIAFLDPENLSVLQRFRLGGPAVFAASGDGFVVFVGESGHISFLQDR